MTTDTKDSPDVIDMLRQTLGGDVLCNGTTGRYLSDHIEEVFAARLRADAPTGASADERTQLRAEQAANVMPQIGPLLDAWEGMNNDTKGVLDEEAPGLVRGLRLISGAMEGRASMQANQGEAPQHEAPAVPKWLTRAKDRLANVGAPFRVGSDLHLLEMAVTAYEALAAPRPEARPTQAGGEPTPSAASVTAEELKEAAFSAGVILQGTPTELVAFTRKVAVLARAYLHTDRAARAREAEDAARYRALCEFEEWPESLHAAFDCSGKVLIDEAIDAVRNARASEVEKLFDLLEWTEAFSAFRGAFDTPVARRLDNSEFAQDARRRMRVFNEAVLAVRNAQGGK